MTIAIGQRSSGQRIWEILAIRNENRAIGTRQRSAGLLLDELNDRRCRLIARGSRDTGHRIHTCAIPTCGTRNRRVHTF